MYRLCIGYPIRRSRNKPHTLGECILCFFGFAAMLFGGLFYTIGGSLLCFSGDYIPFVDDYRLRISKKRCTFAGELGNALLRTREHSSGKILF